MPFTTPRSLRDLRPLIFGNHSLKLQHEPLLGSFAAGGFQKDRLHSMTGKFLDQQNLISIFATQAIRRVNQHHLNLTFGRQIPQTFQARSRQHRSAVTFIFKNPFARNGQLMDFCMFQKQRRLTGNGSFLFLALRGNSGVSGRGLFHFRQWLTWRLVRAQVHHWAPASDKPATFFETTDDHTHIGFDNGLGAGSCAQP